MESAIFGLGVIIISWLLQLIYSWKGRKDIQNKFLVIYSLGTALLVIDCYLNDLKWTGIFNTIVLMMSLITLIKVSSKNNGKVVKKSKKK